MKRWIYIAQLEIARNIRSRYTAALIFLFLVIAIFVAIFSVPVLTADKAVTRAGRVSMLNVISGYLSIIMFPIAFLLGFAAIAGEREGGQLTLLLSLPFSRRDIVIGKFVGRTAVIAIPLFVVGGVIAILTLSITGTFQILTLFTFVGATFLLTAVYMSIAIGFSAATTTSTRALIGIVAIFLLFTYGWHGPLFRLFHNLIRSVQLPFGSPTTWTTIYSVVEPRGAYLLALTRILPRQSHSPDLIGGILSPSILGIVILVCWIIGPLSVGYHRFKRADL
jgi:ABC-2 type transport system permease protein